VIPRGKKEGLAVIDERSRRTVSAAAMAASRRNEGAADRLLELVYSDLKDAARAALRRERKDHTLQPTALVHEAFIRLADQKGVDWKGRTHFLAVSAQAMRRILVDHARRKKRGKRGGAAHRVELDLETAALSLERSEDVLFVDELLAKLAVEDPRQAKILELRFFAGLSVEEVAEALHVSKRTVEADWTMLRAWLRREFARAGDEPGRGPV
jgi:RNA polymerase sigma factor (TIGR02999 family)